MDKKKGIITTILWIARGWGTLVLAFVLFFLIAHLMGGAERNGDEFRKTNEILSFIFFPIGTAFGLALAIKWEGLGGLIGTLCMVVLFAIRFDLLKDFMFVAVILPPCLLYLIYGILSKQFSKRHKAESF